MTTQELYQWQQELKAQPKVWGVEQLFEGTWESTGNLYATREGAEMEVAWHTAHKRRTRVHGTNLHTDDLSSRRWQSKDQPK